jgi:hypothetical protein
MGLWSGLKLSRMLSFSSTVTDESERILIFATSFSRGLKNHQVEGERGSQKKAITANIIVDAPNVMLAFNEWQFQHGA